MDFLAGLWNYGVVFLFILTVVVFVHEGGHYLVARWNGVKVEVFSIGFGREIWGWTDKSGTRWRISLLPLGGYVRMFGDGNLALEIIKNLHFRSKFGLDYTGYWKRNMQLTYVSGFMSENTNRVDINANYGGNWILSNTLDYSFETGNHKIDLLAGQEMIKYFHTEVSAGRDVFASDAPD